MKKDEVLEHFVRITNGKFSCYSESFRTISNGYFFIAKQNGVKNLIVIAKKGICNKFEGEKVGVIDIEKKDLDVLVCPRNHHNLVSLREFFPNLSPVTCNRVTSFGTGDRLGLATKAHAKAFKGKEFFPVFAQQSVRELSRTKRTWRDVLDDASWGVFQSGFEGAFGADADHVKSEKDLEEAFNEGYTMFTIDPSDHVNDVSKASDREIQELYYSAPNRSELERLYLQKAYTILNTRLVFDEHSLFNLIAEYGNALEHVCRCYENLNSRTRRFDFEVSIDETEIPTTPLRHLFIALELHRKGVDFNTLALRLPGEWQKGIDYIGDIEMLRKELTLHFEIARQIGGYRLSLHSGSDKFSVYRTFSDVCHGQFHVKTAGTSYLEALRVIALCDPDLYREIHVFALSRFAEDVASYHVTTDLSRIPNIDHLSDSELPSLLDMPDARQLIHITYGSVLTAQDKDGKFLFRERLYNSLSEHERDHDRYVESHIRKHLDLLSV